MATQVRTRISNEELADLRRRANANAALALRNQTLRRTWQEELTDEEMDAERVRLGIIKK